MDYQVKRDDGKLISHKLIGHGVVPVKVETRIDDFIYLILPVYPKSPTTKG